MNKRILSLILPVIIIVFWYIFTVPIKLFPDYVMPTPIVVMISAYQLIMSGKLLIHVVNTLIKVLLGLILASIIAIPFGTLLGWSKNLEEMSKFVIGVLRPIPPVAWIPFSILWFGIGLIPGTFIIFMGCFFPILIYTVDGVKRTDDVLIEAGRTLGASKFQTITKIIFPSSLPTIISGLKVGVGIALMCTVTAEMVASNSGLGYLIMNSSQLFDTGAVVVGMLSIGIIGLIFDIMFKKIQSKIFW
ncbi:MAG: ABC transporter permease [Methanobrevibacter sp.]|jgi:NitT/TauT family transport system permease protein|nr:ABC transporter permease [Candidatus Methanovirga basalitermitum]